MPFINCYNRLRTNNCMIWKSSKELGVILKVNCKISSSVTFKAHLLTTYFDARSGNSVWKLPNVSHPNMPSELMSSCSVTADLTLGQVISKEGSKCIWSRNANKRRKKINKHKNYHYAIVLKYYKIHLFKYARYTLIKCKRFRWFSLLIINLIQKANTKRNCNNIFIQKQKVYLKSVRLLTTFKQADPFFSSLKSCQLCPTV